MWLILQTLKHKERVMQDLDVWKRNLNLYKKGNFYSFVRLLLVYKEYRNVVIVRIRQESLVKSIFARILFKPMESLCIGTCDIGGGFYIEHGVATIISAKSIGNNCWINQQVTIGNAADGVSRPTIGNRVMIRAGAIVIGNVKNGDDSVIGAGAVVTHDVPDRAVVVGVPAKIIRYRDIS